MNAVQSARIEEFGRTRDVERLTADLRAAGGYDFATFRRSAVRGLLTLLPG
jgi:hypothetical protein